MTAPWRQIPLPPLFLRRSPMVVGRRLLESSLITKRASTLSLCDGVHPGCAVFVDVIEKDGNCWKIPV
jgi:hypothetical protein